jgi:hypothetical protein
MSSYGPSMSQKYHLSIAAGHSPPGTWDVVCPMVDASPLQDPKAVCQRYVQLGERAGWGNAVSQAQAPGREDRLRCLALCQSPPHAQGL